MKKTEQYQRIELALKSELTQAFCVSSTEDFEEFLLKYQFDQPCTV